MSFKFPREKPKLPSHRETAEHWAANQIKKQPDVDPVHVAQMTYILTEIGLFIDPIPDLHVSIVSAGQHYKITVTGFKYLTSYADWGERFLTRSSNTFINSVTKTFTQHSSTGYIKILRVEKMNPLAITNVTGPPPPPSSLRGDLPSSIRTPNIEKAHEKLSNRNKCTKWAKMVVESFNHILKPQDRPHAEAILTEVALFEVASDELTIDITDKIECYAIVVQGQKSVTDDREWINTFLVEREDDQQFDVIKGCFLKDNPNGSITMFHLGKIEFKDSSQGGGGEETRPTYKPTIFPSGRKIRK